MTSIFEHINNAIKQQTSFVCYKKPNDTRLNGLFLKNDNLTYTNSFSEKGFVFAPFNASKKAVIFPLHKARFFSETIRYDAFSDTVEQNFYDETNAGKDVHIALVNKGIEAIRNTNLSKVVLSRKETIVTDLDVLATFKKLIYFYKNAFTYLWFHPKIGLWLGATPETLLKSANENFETMSLAGTQPFVENETISWGKKELEEQQLVTNFIKYQLEPISDEIFISKTKNLRAGNLLHLKTEVSGKLTQDYSLKNLIRALHPTPAVCGFPREASKHFIKENENYNRTFYTGFLGEINFDATNSAQKETHLFVNLRCMNVEKNIVNLFIGGGITKDSNAEKEWLETVAKSKTMKRALSSKL